MAKSSFFSHTGINATNTNVIQSSVISAANSAELAALAYDKLDDRYLGNKTSNPTTDNDGDTLVVGTLYYNTVSNQILVYKDVGWQNLTAAGSLQVSQNLADLANTETARSNLSLGNSTSDTYYVKARADSGVAVKVEGSMQSTGYVDSASYKRSGTTFLDTTGELTNVTLDAGNF